MTHTRLFSLASCLVAVLATSSVTVAQDTARLSLSQCLQTALENNLDLVSARLDPAIAAQQIEESLAPFDGSVSAGVQYDDFDGDSRITGTQFNPATQMLESFEVAGESANEIYNGDFTFSHVLKQGGDYALTYALTDEERSSTSIQAAVNELQRTSNTGESGGFSLTFNQPLLGGFGKVVNTAPIVLARGNLEISREDLRRQAITTLNSVEDAYWDVVAAKEALATFQVSLTRAEDLLKLNKKKVEVGTLAPIEITEAEAGVAQQVEQVIAGEASLENAEDVLLQFMAVPEEDPLWDQSLDLTDQPSFTPVNVDLEAAIETALDKRPEMASVLRQFRNDELSERVARKGTRHQLDLTAVVAPDQQDDDRRVVEPTETITDSEGTFWSLELRYSVPLRNRSAKANYAIARLNTRKSDAQVRKTEQDIRVEVRTAVRNLESGIQRVEAAEKNVELQNKKLEAEGKKFDNGMSTSFEVLTFQNDLADAELRLIQARLDYAKSLAAFERAKGTLLEARGLALGE